MRQIFCSYPRLSLLKLKANICKLTTMEREGKGKAIFDASFCNTTANDPKAQKCDELAYPSSSILCKTMVSPFCKTMGKMTKLKQTHCLMVVNIHSTNCTLYWLL